jgi:hypothetical protein
VFESTFSHKEDKEKLLERPISMADFLGQTKYVSNIGLATFQENHTSAFSLF